ncbi:hypothetical protein L6164_012268 [Bauhinia variegata]|uniref:Uncharacterized protein n=1 Tax=Bauhinia variegata TaxID=167791 RepID=A0ACB9P9J3_BAUVA|nr:hypothetical protein L6164_012268 [Bauhinia variegata]
MSTAPHAIEARHRPFAPMWIWGGPNPRYISNMDIDWEDIVKGIGLLNFNKSEIEKWEKVISEAKHVVLQLEYAARNVTWIDEEEETEVPVCPSLPRLGSPGIRLNLIAVKLPCRKENGGNWSRDVGRLHLQLAAAALAASFKGNYPVYVLFITNCLPIQNLFTCKELVAHEGNVWLYRPNLSVQREKVQLPQDLVNLLFLRGTKWVPPKWSGSSRLENRDNPEDQKPKSRQRCIYEWNYSKFRLWQLTDYDKIPFIDADLLILRNIDFLLGMPEITATGNNATLFNSGVMVLEPSNCTFQLLMDHINEIESYNGGDQGYLNEIFTWWHRIPRHMNFLKHFWIGDEEEKKQMKTRLFGAEPPILLCSSLSGDVAHARWWKVHDAMPEKCVDNLYSWEGMLQHWGETNWTDDESYYPTPPAIITASLSAL